MDTLKHAFAEKLLKIKAIRLQPNEPFQWASGWNLYRQPTGFKLSGSKGFCENRTHTRCTGILS